MRQLGHPQNISRIIGIGKSVCVPRGLMVCMRSASFSRTRRTIFDASRSKSRPCILVARSSHKHAFPSQMSRSESSTSRFPGLIAGSLTFRSSVKATRARPVPPCTCNTSARRSFILRPASLWSPRMRTMAPAFTLLAVGLGRRVSRGGDRRDRPACRPRCSS